MAMVSFESKVHDAGEPDDVARDQRVVAVDQHVGQRAAGGRGPEGLVDLVDGDVAAEHAHEVGDGAVGRRHPQRGAVELAVQRLAAPARWPGRRRWTRG